MRSIIRNFCVALTLCVFLPPGTASAQHFPPDGELASLIQKRVDDNIAVGIVLGVIEVDGSTSVVSAGEAGPGARGLSDRSVFEIGSISKVFTATLLAEMVRQGKVTLSDPVSAHLPDSVGVPSRNGREITLLDLATHHSGLPRDPSNMPSTDHTNPFADYSVQHLYALLSEHELRRDIGSKYEYSNLGAGLLGHVLSRVAGTSYETAVRAAILEPLGMDMTGIELNSEMSKWMSKGHSRQGNIVPLWDLPTLAGAGALRSNVRDMLKFVAANIGQPKTPLEKAMRTTHGQRKKISDGMSVGLNWHILSQGSSKIVWHNGGTAGFRTFIGFDPDRKVGAVVLTNSGHGADDIGFHLINKDIPLAPPTAAIKRSETAVAANILEDYVGKYPLSPQFSITVTLEDGALFAQATGQGKFPIFAESESKFFYKIVDAQISFRRDEDGEVTHLILHQHGRNQVGEKVREAASQAPGEPKSQRNEIAVPANILEEYVGEYEFNPELSITFTLQAGRLFAQPKGNPRKFPVFAESETKFFLKVVDVQFTFLRDETGIVASVIRKRDEMSMLGDKVK